MKFARIAMALAAPLLLASCFLTPGKFDAALTVRKDGTFSYRYTGEIVLLTAASAMNAAAAEEETFDPEAQTCSDEGRDPDTASQRECTSEEMAQKQKEWEKSRAARTAERKRELEMSKAMMGGIDPSDPKTIDEFARRLQGQEGWKQVRHKGNGVFDVQYEISGRLDHAFVFPVFPGFDFIIPFVQVTRDTGNRARIAAPAFAQRKGADGFGAMMGGAMGAPLAGAALPTPEGSFTLTTDANILTNNTQDGPSGPVGAKALKWTVGPLDNKKPEALLQL